MESFCLLIVFGFVLPSIGDSVFAVGRGNGGVVLLVYYKSSRDIENEVDCEVREVWTSVEDPYYMKCIQCSDNQHAIVYHDQDVVGAARVSTCDRDMVGLSVSVLPADQGTRHTIEYGMITGDCIRVEYNNGVGSLERECTPAARRKRSRKGGGARGKSGKSSTTGWKAETTKAKNGIRSSSTIQIPDDDKEKENPTA